MNSDITQDGLRLLLFYNPLTGIFKRISNKSIIDQFGYIAGHVNTLGYHVICINGKNYLAHRLVWLYVYGYFPENEIDHINRVKSDNRLDNLRHVSRSCNKRNVPLQKNNTSKIKGVSWHKPSGRWMVRINVNSKSVYLGLVKRKIRAAWLRWDAEKLYKFPDCETTSTAFNYLKTNGILTV